MPTLYGYASNIGEPLYDDILNSDLPQAEKVKQIQARGQAYRDEADRQKWKDYGRIGLGELVAGSSFLPIMNIPYVGTGLGGALYEIGMGIMEGNKLPEIAKRAGQGFVLGETVGAVPYVGKWAGKTKAGQAVLNSAPVKAVGEGATNLANNLIEKTGTLRPIRALNHMLAQDIKLGENPFFNPFKNTGEVLLDSANPRHRLQADLINKYNPAPDDYHTWIRNADDIYTFEDTLKPPQFDADFIGNDFDPSYTWDMAQDAIKNGEMEVFSSYPIEKGVFVTPSTMEAQSYAGSGKIYSKKVPLDDVAWIDEHQGQYAPIDKEYMEAVFNDAKKGIKRLNKQDYRNLGKQYYSEEFMPNGIYKDNYGQIDYIKHNKGKDEIQVLKHYPEMNKNINEAEYGYTSNHKNELDREYDHLINVVDDDVLDFVIERMNNGKNIYKMTDRLNKKKR